MTSMQMEFNKLQESKRHNLEQEGVSQREVGVKEKKSDSEIFANYTKGAANISQSLFGKGGVINGIAQVGKLFTMGF